MRESPEESETPDICIIVQFSHGLKMRTNLTNCDYQQINKGKALKTIISTGIRSFV